MPKYVDRDSGEVIDLDMAAFVRNPFSYDAADASLDSALGGPDHPWDASKTQQHFAEDADINTIVRRFNLTGELPTDFRSPQYGDFTGVSDYQTALDSVIAADNEFMRLPAEVRERFNNDPQQLLDFVSDSKNRDEAAKLGLLKVEPPKPAPFDVRVVPDPVATPK